MRHQYVEEEGRRLCVRLCVRVFETRGSKIAFHAPTNESSTRSHNEGISFDNIIRYIPENSSFVNAFLTRRCSKIFPIR